MRTEIVKKGAAQSTPNLVEITRESHVPPFLCDMYNRARALVTHRDVTQWSSPQTLLGGSVGTSGNKHNPSSWNLYARHQMTTVAFRSVMTDC